MEVEDAVIENNMAMDLEELEFVYFKFRCCRPLPPTNMNPGHRYKEHGRRRSIHWEAKRI